MIRRLVGCHLCQKRFATLRGSTLCPACRPNESIDSQPSELSTYYGGTNLTMSTTTSQQRNEEALLVVLEDAQQSSSARDEIIMMGNYLVGDSSNIASGGGAGNDDDYDACNVCSTNHFLEDHHGHPVPRAISCKRIEHREILSSDETKKRHHLATTVASPLAEGVADGCSTSSTGVLHPLHSRSGDLPPSFRHASSNHNEAEEVHIVGDIMHNFAKKRKIDGGDDVPLTEGTKIIGSDIDRASTEVLIADAADGKNYCSEMNETNYRKDNNNYADDDDSDVVWLGTSPSKRTNNYDVDIDNDSNLLATYKDVANTSTTPRKSDYHSQFEKDEGTDVQVDEFDDSYGFYATHCDNNNEEVGNTDNDGCASSDGGCLRDHASDTESKIQPDSTTMQLLVPSPKRDDVCYICGSDLSRLKTGLRGRVAHMKRCSAKNNGMAFRGSFHEDLEDDTESSVAVSKNEPSQNDTESVSINPYTKGQWHRHNTLNSQPKQTVLRDFFKAPVKCLTNVLMAGARQVAKKEAFMKAKIATPSKVGKESNPNSRWGSNNRRNGSCPNYKRIPGTDFICDGFQFATRTLSENYFLTHFHSDHYGGISKNWSDGIIYCSLPTANLVHQQLRVEKKFLHPIPLNTPTTITSKGKPVVVTLFDANHCPGAVMFLFEIGNKKVLHVGDFRFNRDLMMQVPQLLAFSNGSSRLDEIMLDTTYCDTKYTLPTQEDAISAAIEVAEKEMITSIKDKTSKTLFLFGSYTIGKEKIYMSVAEHMKMKVYVDSRRYQILTSLELPKERMQMFTMDKSETNLWVVPLGSVNFKQMPDYLEEANKNKVFVAPYGRVVGFRPTGWTYKGQVKGQTTLAPLTSGSSLITSKISGIYSIHGVPYSEHSSFPELVDCLDCLKPKKITPTVSVSKSQELVELLLNAQRGKGARK